MNRNEQKEYLAALSTIALVVVIAIAILINLIFNL